MIRRTGSILFLFFSLPSQFLPFFLAVFAFFVFFCSLLFAFISLWLDVGIVDRVSFSSFLYRGSLLLWGWTIGIKVCKFSMGFKHLKINITSTY